MMDHRALVWPHLDRFHPQIVVGNIRQHKVAIDILAIGGDLVRLSRIQHQVWLPEHPTLGELPGRRHLLGVTLRRPFVHPLGEGADLWVREATRVLKLAKVRRRLPRRHGAALRVGLDQSGPGAGVLVAQQREGADLARPVAALAFSLEDRRHVPRERDLRVRHRHAHRRLDGTAERQRLRLRHRVPGQHRIQSRAQVAALHLRRIALDRVQPSNRPADQGQPAAFQFRMHEQVLQSNRRPKKLRRTIRTGAQQFRTQEVSCRNEPVLRFVVGEPVFGHDGLSQQ